MSSDWVPYLYPVSAGWLAGIFFLLCVALQELGFRLGAKVSRRGPTGDAQGQALEAGILTLFGLLLAFTFSMAANRYDLRKQIVLDESNAIGTAFLRASALPEGTAANLQRLLRSYLAARLDLYRGGDVSASDAGERAARLQKELWRLASEQARRAPTPVAALMLSALNDAIDLREKQSAAFENHIPETLLLFLFLISLTAMGAVGYLNGLGSRRHFVLSALFAMVVSLTLFLVLDLDRPRRGLIRLSHESLLRLQSSFEQKD
jgi:hypothetical protein